MNKLGRLERIDLRDIWRTEDQDFTPWLAREENVALLGDTLGIELEVEFQEKDVGPFRADILCKDVSDDSWVLIENQLERTDHKHLGQLMTYAAGLQAVTIIWMAATFHNEHREAIDWLNKITDEKFRFFALEVELWKIGESAAAPKFNIVSKPNEWSKQVRAASRRIEQEALTDTKRLYLDYWSELHEELKSHPVLRTQKPRPQHWTILPIGRSGIRLGALLSAQRSTIGIELYLSDENAQNYFHELEAMKHEIETDLGFSPQWKSLPNKQASRILFVRENSPLEDPTRWPEYRKWMTETLEAFNRAFRERVKKLEGISYLDEEGE